MVKIPENMQSQFKLAKQEDAQRSGFVELVTLWFSYAFVVGCSGLFWGAIFAMGVSPVGVFRPVLALLCLSFVFGGARYLYTKTKTLVLGEHLVRSAT